MHSGIENNCTMSGKIDVAEDNQQNHLLKITDISKTMDTSLGDIKLKLDLSDDSAQISLHGEPSGENKILFSRRLFLLQILSQKGSPKKFLV